MAAARIQEDTQPSQGPRLLNGVGGYVPFLSRGEAEGQEGDVAACSGGHGAGAGG